MALWDSLKALPPMPALPVQQDWLNFRIHEGGEEFCLVACPKDWQRAIEVLARRLNVSALVARAQLLNATNAVSANGDVWSTSDGGPPYFSIVPGQSGLMINLATWAMDNNFNL